MSMLDCKMLSSSLHGLDPLRAPWFHLLSGQVLKAAASEGWPHVLLLLKSMTEDWRPWFLSNVSRVTYPPLNNPDNGTCPICKRFTHWPFQKLNGFQQNLVGFLHKNRNDITSCHPEPGHCQPRCDQLQHCDQVLWPFAALACAGPHWTERTWCDNPRTNMKQPQDTRSSITHQETTMNHSSSIFVNITLVGGLEHFLFSHILGIIIPIDFHIVQRGSNHQPEHIIINSCNRCAFTVPGWISRVGLRPKDMAGQWALAIHLVDQKPGSNIPNKNGGWLGVAPFMENLWKCSYVELSRYSPKQM